MNWVYFQGLTRLNYAITRISHPTSRPGDFDGACDNPVYADNLDGISGKENIGFARAFWAWTTQVEETDSKTTTTTYTIFPDDIAVFIRISQENDVISNQEKEKEFSKYFSVFSNIHVGRKGKLRQVRVGHGHTNEFAIGNSEKQH